MSVTETASRLEAALSEELLHAAFQPVVRLDTEQVVGFEALARWHDPTLTPGVVFPLAAAEGRLCELDVACRRAAVTGAIDAGLGTEHLLFVNVEASTLGTDPRDEGPDALSLADGRLRLVIELTERALLSRPREVLKLVAHARERGWGVALDDVGAEPESLTLLPFVEPDVIKLDLNLVQHRPGIEQGRVMAAVLAHAESTGAAVLAEGIETDAHLEQALTYGAVLGQGWHFGRPGPLTAPSAPARTFELLAPRTTIAPTPFSLVDGSPRLAIGRRDVLLGISNHLEALGLGHDDLVTFGTFQTADRFTPETRRRYADLARTCALVGVFGVGMDDQPAPGVRGATLSTNDDLVNEWTVVVVGPHYAGALIARDLGDDGADESRRFEFLVTHDRPTVLCAARSLMRRLAGTC